MQNSPYSESDSSLTFFSVFRELAKHTQAKVPAVLLNTLGMSWHSSTTSKNAEEWQQHSRRLKGIEIKNPYLPIKKQRASTTNSMWVMTDFYYVPLGQEAFQCIIFKDD